MKICDLQFIPDGRFLVSAGDNGIVRLWDNGDGNYEQLQEWNVIQEDVRGIGLHLNIDISACSKYVLVSTVALHRVILISVDNGETIRSLPPQPIWKIISKVFFLSIVVLFLFVFWTHMLQVAPSSSGVLI